MTLPGRLHDERNALLDRETRRLRRFWLHPAVLAVLVCVWGGALMLGLRGDSMQDASFPVVNFNRWLEQTTTYRTARGAGLRPVNSAVFQSPRFTRDMVSQWGVEDRVAVEVEQRDLPGGKQVLATLTGEEDGGRRWIVIGPRPAKGRLFVPDRVLAVNAESDVTLEMVRRGLDDGLRAAQEEWLAASVPRGAMSRLVPAPFPVAVRWTSVYGRTALPLPIDTATDWRWSRTASPGVFVKRAGEALEWAQLVPLAFYEEVGISANAGQMAHLRYVVPEDRTASLRLTWDWHPRALFAMWLLYVAALPVAVARRLPRLIARYGAETLRVTLAGAEVEQALAGTWRRAWACWLLALLAPVCLAFVLMWARLGPAFILPPIRSEAAAQTLLEPNWLGPLALLLLLSGMAGWGMMVSALVVRPGASALWQGAVALLLSLLTLPAIHLLLGRLPNTVGAVETRSILLSSGAYLTGMGVVAWWLAGRMARKVWRGTVEAMEQGARD